MLRGTLYRLLAAAYLGQRRMNRWIHRRFTPLGLVVALGMVLTLGSASTDQTMGMAVFLVLASMLALALVMAPFFRGRFTIERQAPRLVTAGDPFTVRVRVANGTPRIQRGLDYVEDLRDLPLSVVDVVRRLRLGFAGGLPASIRSARVRPQPLPALPALGHADVQVEITAWRRGPLVLAGGAIGRTDPFGLFRGLLRIPGPQTVLVMPRRHPLPPLSLPGTSQYQQGGVALAAGIGESEDVVALREYRRGDPLKRVHWRSSARTGKLVVKEFQDEWFVRHALVLDTCCPPAGDILFEEAVAVAASFACTIPDQESLLDLLFVAPAAVCVTTGRGVGHAQQMLEVLATVRPCRDPGIGGLEPLVLQHVGALSGCVLVLLAWDRPRRDLVQRLRVRGLPLLVLLVVPAGGAGTVDLGDPADRPERLVVLESGRVAEGLRGLAGAPAGRSP